MKIQDASYPDIESLICRADQRKGAMQCTFRCPVTDREVEAQADLATANSGSLKTKVKQSATQGLTRSFSRTAMQWVRSVFGNGAMAKIANDVVHHTTSAVGQPRFSEAEKQAAILHAFRSVGASFRFDSERGGFVHADATASLPAAGA